MALGGNGGIGGIGKAVDVTLGQANSNLDQSTFISSLSKVSGGGVLAQSVGGAGGSGGSAAAYGGGIVNLAIGNQGAAGAAAGTVSIVNNAAVITTYGDHAVGIDAQSVGGGGGKGGSAFSLGVSEVLSTSVSIGGGGGSGGPGGAVSISNMNQVLTFGSNAPGLKVQSIGGGGGHGGAALATAFAISQVPDVPALSVAVSIGGKGGSGNVAGSASVANSGFVASGGHGAPAIIAQSVGGGGGFGGDASASAFTGGGAEFKMSASVAIGGTGGTGASGGVTTVTNDGILATFGQNAPAIVAQSIGGGGGFGGAGDVSAQTNDSNKLSFAASVAVGGAGGIGGAGQEVVVTNRGGIATRGDTSDGILAQSVGGGGGVGGGGAGKANNDSLSITVDVGGRGGSGNEAAYVQVQNFNTIVTSGLGSMGVTAQSIGGGGGRGGKGGATAGGAAKAPDAPLTNALNNGLNSGQQVETIEPGVVKIGPVSFDTDDIDPKKLSDFVTSRASGDESDDGDAKSLSVAVAVGGRAGAGGDGNVILLENSGQIVTSGALANGLTAQSIGGGGGIGGAGTASTTNDNTLGFSLALGGRGGSAGGGGATTVNMKAGSSIATTGSGATGILAQSIGGGGGNATMSGAANQAGLFGGRSLGVTIGGEGGSSGAGGKVTVNHQGNLIQTEGKNAIGIIAQSIGGGGGLSHVISSDQIKKNSRNDIEDKFNLSLKFGGSGVVGGAAETVSVALPSLSTENSIAISTSGYLAHGILAQSIGGFGGAALGGKTDGIDIFVPGSRSSAGAGGAIDVAIGRSVTTEGEGAYGILAQSIGGGGGLGGDFSARKYDPIYIPFNTRPQGLGYNGDGGAINVSLSKGVVQTEGGSAPAIFAQSLGGGGGHIGTEVGIMSGTFGGAGAGGPIHISVDGGAKVIAVGSDSSGISAQSDGGLGGSSIRVDVGSLSTVQGGGGEGAAIRFRGGSRDPSKPNIISNNGIIQTGVPGDIAVWVDSATTITNSGKLTGDLCGPVTGGHSCSDSSPLSDNIGSLNITNSASGVINAGGNVILGFNGVIKNAGLISMGGAGNVVRTQFIGDLEQSETGRLEFDLDLSNGNADFLEIEGAAALLGTVTLNPMSLVKGDTTIASATDGLQASNTFTAEASHIFSYLAEVRGNELALVTDADFGSAAGLSNNNRGLAGHLQRIWENVDVGFGVGFAALANVDNAQEYDAALNVLSGRAISAVVGARYEASLRMVNSAYSCPAFAESSMHMPEESCVWTRIDAVDFDRDASGSGIDYNGQSTIVTVGGQHELDTGWLVAGVVGYENSRISSAMGATVVDGKAGLGVLALKRQIGPWVIGGAVDLGYGSYDSLRNITFGSTALEARGSSNAFNAGLHFNASYQKSFGTWYVKPQADLNLAYLRLDGFQETGAAAFNLDVSKSDNVVFSATPAVELGRRINLKSGTVVNAFASAGVSFLSGNDWDTEARFANAAPSSGGFGTTLDTPDVLGRFSAGVEVYNEGALNLRAQYDADVASDYLSHGAALRLSVKF